MALLLASLALGAALRAWLAFNDDGIYWPDEIYQSLEPAHRLVFGYGLIAWEFVEGARNWALPGLVAALLKLCAAVGLDDPRQYLSVVRLVFSAIGVATAFGSYFLARRLGARPVFAACGAALFALVGPAIYFGPRALAETASALPIVLGFAWALPSAADRRERIVGASLLGLAVLLRLQNAVFCGTLLCVLAARREWRPAAEATAVFVGWAVVLGLLDKLTWGDWFQSAAIYVRYNLLLGGGPITGSSPAEYYVAMLFKSMPATVVIAAVLCGLAAPRARSLLFVAAAFLILHTALPNKAYRYILPVVPLLTALAGLGLETLLRDWGRTVAYSAAGVLLISALWSAAQFHTLTFGDLGPYEKERPAASAYDEWGPVNRLLIAAHRQPDLCGLKIESDHLVWTGGYSYLHRPVPLYGMTGPRRESGLYNYVIAARGPEASGIVEVDANRVLIRLPIPTCAPDPAYDDRLPGGEQIRRLLS